MQVTTTSTDPVELLIVSIQIAIYNEFNNKTQHMRGMQQQTVYLTWNFPVERQKVGQSKKLVCSIQSQIYMIHKKHNHSLLYAFETLSK